MTTKLYLPKNFIIQEFVPKSVYTKFGDNAYWFLDPNLIYTIDKIRDYYKKPITVNNWHTGGKFQYRGLRTNECPEYTPFSQHALGNALDFDIEGVAAADVRKWILNNSASEMCKYISCIEDGVSWVHMDTRPLNQSKILVVNP